MKQNLTHHFSHSKALMFYNISFLSIIQTVVKLTGDPKDMKVKVKNTKYKPKPSLVKWSKKEHDSKTEYTILVEHQLNLRLGMPLDTAKLEDCQCATGNFNIFLEY